MIVSLLKAEFIKFYNSRTTKIISIIYVFFILIILSFNGVISNISGEANSSANNIAYGSLILFLSILPIANVITNVCSEFRSNMMKQNIINGMTRNQFVLSKFLSNFIVSMYYSLLFLLFSLILSKGALQYTFHYALSLFFVFNIASSFAFIFKRAGVAIAAFYVYYSFGEFLIYSRILSVFDFKLDSIFEATEILPFTTKANLLIFIPEKQLIGIFACLIIIALMLGIQSLTIRNRSL